MSNVDLTDIEITTPVQPAPIELAESSTTYGPQSLLIRQIRRDGGTQARIGLNEETVQEYAELMREQRWDFRSLQRPIVLFDGEAFWLADGFHRIEAAQRAQLSDFPVDVLRGTQRDAVLRAAGANSQHGLRRTNADKRRAVELLLKDDEWRQWSDRKIADVCAIDHKTVADVRRSLGGEIPHLTTRQGVDGKSYPVAPAAPKAPPPKAPPPTLHPDYEHQIAVERILKDATTPDQVQEAYTHARQTRDLMMYNKLMGMIDRAMDATAKAEGPAAPPVATAESIVQRTPQDLIDAGVDLRRHGAWFVAIGTRNLMRGWEIRAAAPFDQIVETARAEIARRTPPPAPAEAEPIEARSPAVPPRPRRPVSADVSATVKYINDLESYASALEAFIMALQKQAR